jgi:protein gp37
VKGNYVFNDKLNVLPDGHRSWTFPLDWKGAKHPKLGSGNPGLIFVADMSDLFHEGRSDDLVTRVIPTVIASRYGHIAELVTKRTERMAQFLTTLNPRTVDRWQPRIWTAFSAENQEWFDRRWEDMRRLVDAGWFSFESLAPLLAPVTLPDDFLSLGKRTWVIVGAPKLRMRIQGSLQLGKSRAVALDTSHSQMFMAPDNNLSMAEGLCIPPIHPFL